MAERNSAPARARLRPSRSPEAAGQQAIRSLALIAGGFTSTAQTRLHKAAQLYNTIAQAIADGRLTVGSKLPGERDLADACGISLGTVQKSLAMLTRDGQITREHGRGSFVQLHRRPLHELWHYRFRDPLSGTLLPVYARVIERFRSLEDGPWSPEIGPDPNGYVHIKRLIDVDGKFVCWSLMTLAATRFGRLLEFPKADIERINIKSLLHSAFNATTIAVRQTVTVAPAALQVCRDAGWSNQEACLVSNITALGPEMVPLSFQTIIVPSTAYPMEIGATPDSKTP